MRSKETQRIVDWLDSWEYPLTLYREVMVDSVDDIKFDRLGDYWTPNRKKAFSPWGRNVGGRGRDSAGSRSFIIEIIVDEEDVDRSGSIAAIRRWPNEEEIRMFPARNVKLAAIWDGDERIPFHDERIGLT